MPWQASNLISPMTTVDCGPISVEFFRPGSVETTLNPELFQDDRVTDPANILKVLYTEKVALKGSYPIKYRVFHTNYPLNTVELDFPFTVTVINACANPVSLLPSQLTDQSYTITDIPKTYTVPDFTIDPPWCDIVWSFTVMDLDGQFAVTFDADQETRQFTFFNDNNISLAGMSVKKYSVTVKATTGTTSTVEATATFNLSLLNPCLDRNFVSLTKVALPSGLIYRLYDYWPIPNGYSFTHDSFTVSTQPQAHSFCGDILYNVKFEGNQISDSSRPMTYDMLTRTFEIYSENLALVGQRTIEVQAYLKDYPTLVSDAPNLVTLIEIEQPCTKPISITATNQTNPDPYDYSSQGAQFYVNPPAVYPPVCPVTYECVSYSFKGKVSDCKEAALSFSTGSGSLNFNTIDNKRYPPGDYTFTLKAEVGSVVPISTSFSFDLKLIDTCEQAVLSNLQQIPFIDLRYTLGKNLLRQSFDVSKLVAIDSRVDCGEIGIQFMYENGDPLDESLFNVDIPNDDSIGTFTVIKQNLRSSVGEYLIKYRAYMKNYSQKIFTLLEEPFKVTIVEPPSQSDYIFNVAPNWLDQLEDQYVTLGDNLLYTMGDNVDMFGNQVNVRLDLRRVFRFASYDSEINTLILLGKDMTEEDLGIHKIRVEIMYNDPRGKTQFFQSQFYVHVTPDPNSRDNDQQESQIDEVNDYDMISDDLNVLKYFEPQERLLNRPIPYIANFTPTGLMTIAWDRLMQPIKKPERIPPTLVAVDPDFMDRFNEQSFDPRRLLTRVSRNETWFNDIEANRLMRVMLLDALQVQIKRDQDSEELADVENFSWNVVGFEEDYIYLQINFTNPEQVSFQSQDYITVTFWGVEFFKSYQGIEVEFGTELYWKIYRQISIEEAQNISGIQDMVTGFSYAALFAIVLFVGLGGRLLPTWMFLNSMQLIVHTPLVDTYMPTNLHIFIQRYLNLFRFNANSINDSLEDSDREQGMDNYKLALDNDSDYSVLMNDCGYKVRFSRNLVLILAFASFFVLLIAVCTLFDCWRAHRRGSLKRSGRFIHASWMSNFTLRFFYMVFFEVFLCLMIHTLNRMGQNDFLWTLSLLFFVASLAFIAFVCILLCFGGPYIPKAFQEKSLLKSWWSVRPLNAVNDQTVAQQVTQQDNKDQNYLISQQEIIRNCQSAPSNDLNSDRHLIEIDQQQAVDEEDNYLDQEDQEVNTPERSLVFNDERAFTNSIGRSTQNRQASSNFSQVILPNALQQRQFAPSSSTYEGGEGIIILQDNLSHGSTMMQQEACKRIELQDQVQVPLSYRTLFYGLKVNHEHNVGPVHLLTFILRRVLFSLIIVFGPSWNLQIIHSIMLLAATCLVMLLLLSIDGQWEESLINYQHTANEFIFYVLCCTLICFTGLVTDARQNLTIGYLCIALVVTLIFYNLIVIVFDLLRFVMVLSKRYLHRSPKSLKLVLQNIENKFNKINKSKRKSKGKKKTKKTKPKQVEASATKISSVQKLKAWFKSKFGKKAQVPAIAITPEIDQASKASYEPDSLSISQKSQTMKDQQAEQKASGKVDEELLQPPQTDKTNRESEIKIIAAKTPTRNLRSDFHSPHSNNQFTDLEKYSGRRSGAGHVLVDLKTPKVGEEIAEQIRQQTSHSSIPNTLSQMSLNNDIIAALDRIKIKAQNPTTAINALNNKNRNQGHFKEYSQISETQDANDNLQFAYADADQSPDYAKDLGSEASEFQASSSDHIDHLTKQLEREQKRAEASSRVQDPLHVLALTAKSTNKIKSFLDKQNRILSRTPKEKRRSLKKLYEGSELSFKDKTQDLSLEQQDQQQIHDFNHSAIQDILGRSFKEFSDKFACNQNYQQDSRDEVFINLNKKESKGKKQEFQDEQLQEPQKHLSEVFDRENYKFASKQRSKEHINIYDRIQSQPRRGILFKSSNTRTPAAISTLNPVSRDLTPDRQSFSLTPHGAYTAPNNNRVQPTEKDESLVNLQLNWHHVVAESRYTHRQSDLELNPAEDFNRGLGMKGKTKSEISIDQTSNSVGSDFKRVNLRNRREFGEGFNTGINVTRQISRVEGAGGGGAQSVGFKSGQLHLINKITKTNMMKTNKRSKSLVSNVSADKASRSNSIQRTGKQLIRDHIMQQRINGDFYD